MWRIIAGLLVVAITGCGTVAVDHDVAESPVDEPPVAAFPKGEPDSATSQESAAPDAELDAAASQAPVSRGAEPDAGVPPREAALITELTDEQLESLREADQLSQQVIALYPAGRAREAIPLARRSLAIRQAILGEEHRDYATSLHDLGVSYRHNAEYAKAEPLLVKAIEIRSKVLGTNHPDYTNSINSLAVVYYAMGEYAKAAPLFRQAMEIDKEILGEEHPSYVTRLQNLAVLYMHMGEYAKAEPLTRQAMEIRKKALGEDHPDYANSLNNLAVLYQAVGEYAKAEPLQRQAMEIRKKAAGEDHPDYANSLDTLAALYADMGEYGKAEALYRQAMEIRKNILGEGHPGHATSLHHLAALYDRTGEYAKAEPLYRQAIKIRNKTLGEAHPDYAASLNNLADLYRTMGEHAKAEPLQRQVLEIWRKALGEDHPHYATSLNNLALLHQSMGNYTEAEPLIRKAMEISRKVFGADHPSYATSLAGLASLYGHMGEYAEAESLYRQAMEIRRNILGEEHRDYANSLNNLASLYQGMGEYAKAEVLCQQARAIWRKTLGEKHPNYAISLHNLAELYRAMGQYAKAEPLHRQAVGILEEARGRGHPDYAASLNNLASLYQSMGEYSKAEPLYRQAVEILKKAVGEAHTMYGISLSSLAQLYGFMGEYSKAEPLHRQAMEIQRKALGEKHPFYATSVNNLASRYERMGEYAKAEALYRQALEIRRQALGEAHPDYAASLNNLALLYQRMGEYAKAEPLYRQATAIRRRALGEEHPDHAASVNNLAFLYQGMGEYAEAEPLYRQAMHIRKKALGEEHPDYAASLNNLAALYHVMGEYAHATDFAMRDVQLRTALVLHLAGVVSEAEAMNFAAKHLRRPDVLLSASPRSGHPADKTYAALWDRRGLIQQVVTARQRAVAGLGSPEASKLYAQYQRTRQALAHLVLAPTPDDSDRLASQRARVDQLGQEKETLERRLSASVPEFAGQLAAQRRPHTDLATALPEGAVFVDFAYHDHIEQDPDRPGSSGMTRTPHCTAFLLARGEPVIAVPLGPAEPIDGAVTAWRRSMIEGVPEPDLRELRRRLWQPIENQMPEGTTMVYLCPDGTLTGLPWVALPGKSPGGVLLDDYALAVVPHGRFLLEQLDRPSGRPGVYGQLLAVGDVSYDTAPRQPTTGTPLLASSLRGPALEDGATYWKPLPATGAELADLAALAGERTVRVFRRAEAGTEAVTAALPDARWAHFATHGFFADPRFRSALQAGPEGFDGERRTAAGRSPLVLSGLVLAGANRPRGTDPLGLPAGDTGILTAEAIAGLPLDGLDLVVLSACETGLGEVAGGEGVLGLTRAFHLAGARHVVASLWKVDDRATAALMKLFYEHLWQQNLPPHEALRQAQRTMIHEYDAKAGALRGPGALAPVARPALEQAPELEQPLPPFYWAAFIASGAAK